MLGRLIRLLFLHSLQQWRERFPRSVMLLSEAFSVGLSLTVYWYTAKAFGNAGMSESLRGYAPDYFHYIIFNEVTLYLPTMLLTGFLCVLREAHGKGVLESFLLLPMHRLSLMGILILPVMTSELLRGAVLLVFASTVFGLSLTLEQLAILIFVQAMAAPLFGGIGLIAGRGFPGFWQGGGGGLDN